MPSFHNPPSFPTRDNRNSETPESFLERLLLNSHRPFDHKYVSESVVVVVVVVVKGWKMSLYRVDLDYTSVSEKSYFRI